MTDELDPEPFAHIVDPKKRAYLTAFSLLGHHGKSATAAGIAHSLTRTRGWRKDDEFMEAMEEARLMAAEGLEDVARERATEGVRNYKFDKDGIPLRHPDECECGHPRLAHPMLVGEETSSERGVGDHMEHPCTMEECGCEEFTGRPYYEHSYSDTLLIFLTKGALPERYREIREVRGMLARLDLNQLPNHLVARIAAGEHPEAVIAAGASEAGISPGELVRGALKPPEPNEGDATGVP